MHIYRYHANCFNPINMFCLSRVNCRNKFIIQFRAYLIVNLYIAPPYPCIYNKYYRHDACSNGRKHVKLAAKLYSHLELIVTYFEPIQKHNKTITHRRRNYANNHINYLNLINENGERKNIIIQKRNKFTILSLIFEIILLLYIRRLKSGK